MNLRIDYTSVGFPPSHYHKTFDVLTTSWDEVLWAALTLGRPDIFHVFRHGPASFHEALFRMSLVRMAIEEAPFHGYLHRTGAFEALDPTEKGMVSYFLGMTLCKLFASRLLHTPWLLHLDVFRPDLDPSLEGRSRPDLVGVDITGDWHAFECKGRSSMPSAEDKQKAKDQAQRLVSVNGKRCSLHISSFAYFRSGQLEFYWRDPEPVEPDPIKVPLPREEWRYYYEPALSFASDEEEPTFTAARAATDVKVEIHPKIRALLVEGLWGEAHDAANQMRVSLIEEGYQPDGIKVFVGDSWRGPRKIWDDQ